MMSHGNYFNALGVLKIDNAEGELAQKVAAVLSIDSRPAPGRRRNTFNGGVERNEKCL